MNNGMTITPEVLEKINKAHTVSNGIMNNFKAEEPEAFALSKFNPVSQESNKQSEKVTSTAKSSKETKKAPKVK